MTTTLSPRGTQLLRALARNLQLVEEHAKAAPAEADAIYAALIAHVRSARPLLMTGGVL